MLVANTYVCKSGHKKIQFLALARELYEMPLWPYEELLTCYFIMRFIMKLQLSLSIERTSSGDSCRSASTSDDIVSKVLR